MIKKYLFIIFAVNCFTCAVYGQNISLTYEQAIKAYQRLDEEHEDARMFEYGKTDCGESLRLFVISPSGIFNPDLLHAADRCVIFINNGIHAGEPDGIDASVQLATNLLTNPLYHRLLENLVVCIVPVFNIDGALKRGCCSRANQDGPVEYGFRANDKNLDLNRDFIKTDTRNTRSLISILRSWNPDVLIDTHVSDGADYQYTMTLISGQHNKLSGAAGSFMKNVFVPALFEGMKEKNDEMTPYVNTAEPIEIPDSGIFAFMESPRFLGGYNSLYDCFTFTVETHMLKPFPERVKSTLNLLTVFIETCSEKSAEIIDARKNGQREEHKLFYYNWKPNTAIFSLINFRGYQAAYKPSKVTGSNRLFYDHSSPFTKPIKYYDEYYPADTFRVPSYFLIPQAWEEITSRLEKNGVTVIRVNADSMVSARVLTLENYETVKQPYEGHYLHSGIKFSSSIERSNIRKGDYLIPMPQKNMRFALETLVPDATDSYFAWGFFDSILQQKEWFSSYVFEDLADSLLKSNPDLKVRFNKFKAENPSAPPLDQLDFIYRHSPYFEKSFLRYPVLMID